MITAIAIKMANKMAIKMAIEMAIEMLIEMEAVWTMDNQNRSCQKQKGGIGMTEKYEMIKEIGHGSRAHVYLVKNRDTQEMVAMKRYEEDGQESRRELEVLRTLKKRGIPYLLDCFRDENGVSIFMEYISGKTLRQLMDEKKIFSEEQTADICVEILKILSFFHKRRPQWIYGDLKPENIMISKEGEVYLIDFGSVLYRDEKNARMMGNRMYSPDGWNGILPYRDTYALGMILYEMLTGTTYHNGILNGKADVVQLSEGCRSIMQKAVRLNPDEGYKDAACMLCDAVKWQKQIARGGCTYHKDHRYLIGDTVRFFRHGFIQYLYQSFLLLLVFVIFIILKYEWLMHGIRQSAQQDEIQTHVVYNQEIGNRPKMKDSGVSYLIRKEMDE